MNASDDADDAAAGSKRGGLDLRRRIRPWHVTWIVAGPFIAVLLWLLFTAPVGQPAARTLAAPAPGSSFYLLGDETQGLEIGQLAPDFQDGQEGESGGLTDLDGRPLRLEDYRGRPLWIVFWATWCPPCQQETPDLRAAYEANRDKGLAVLAISVQEPADDVRDFVSRYGLSYDIGLDRSGSVLRRYSVFGLPTHYFVGAHGRVVERYLGPLTRAEMDARIARILRSSDMEPTDPGE